MMIGHLVLTNSDIENIILWYQRAFHQKDDDSQSDKNTFTKLQAVLLSDQENEDRISFRVGGFGT